MLLSKISEEIKELNAIIGYDKLFESYERILAQKEVNREILLKWGVEMRHLSKTEVVLEKRKFESKIIQEYAKNYLMSVRELFSRYDRLINLIPWEAQDNVKREINESVVTLCDSVREIKEKILEIRTANIVISNIMKETWEPLPGDKKEHNVNNIIVSSETRSMSLNNVSNDVNNLDQFFNNICFLIGQDKNENNNIYLRKVETGSLTVAVSCAMGIDEIIKFMFFCVQLCQDTIGKYLDNEKKGLNNEEKKLKVINDSMNMSKEILKIDVGNKEADEAIQRCGVHLLNFLENNPTGTINGKHYDTGVEKLKIEEKENE